MGYSRTKVRRTQTKKSAGRGTDPQSFGGVWGEGARDFLRSCDGDGALLLHQLREDRVVLQLHPLGRHGSRVCLCAVSGSKFVPGWSSLEGDSTKRSENSGIRSRKAALFCTQLIHKTKLGCSMRARGCSVDCRAAAIGNALAAVQDATQARVRGTASQHVSRKRPSRDIKLE